MGFSLDVIETLTRTKTGTCSDAAVSHPSVRKIVALYSAERDACTDVSKSPRVSVVTDLRRRKEPPTKRRLIWTDS